MCRTLSDTDRDAPSSVPGSVVCGQATSIINLEIGVREGGCQIGRLAGAHALARRPASYGEGSPLRHPDLFFVGLSNADRGTTLARGGHKKLFLAREICRLGGGAPLSP